MRFFLLYWGIWLDGSKPKHPPRTKNQILISTSGSRWTRTKRFPNPEPYGQRLQCVCNMNKPVTGLLQRSGRNRPGYTKTWRKQSISDVAHGSSSRMWVEQRPCSMGWTNPSGPKLETNTCSTNHRLRCHWAERKTEPQAAPCPRGCERGHRIVKCWVGWVHLHVCSWNPEDHGNPHRFKPMTTLGLHTVLNQLLSETEHLTTNVLSFFSLILWRTVKTRLDSVSSLIWLTGQYFTPKRQQLFN